MTIVIACLIWLTWPLFAFAGGLAFAPMAGLAGLLLLPTTATSLRPRVYMIAIFAYLAFAAVSAFWLPRPFLSPSVDFSPGHLDLDVDNEGILFCVHVILIGVVIAAMTRAKEEAAKIIRHVAVGALLAQLIICAVLAAFEREALDLFAFAMPNDAEGVQNITRNNQIMAMAAPALVFGLASGRSRAALAWIAAAVVAVEGAIFLHRGVDAGIVAILFSGLAVAVVGVFPRIGFKVLGGGVAVVLLAAPFVMSVFATGADATLADDSIGWRLAIWDRTLEEVWREPIRGAGVGVLRTITETIPSGYFAGEPLIPLHSHSMPLQLWAETGAIGATLLAAAIFLAGWRMPCPASLGRTGLQAAGIVGAMTAIACVSYDLWNEWWWAAGGFLVALTALGGRKATDPESASQAAGIASDVSSRGEGVGPLGNEVRRESRSASIHTNNFHLMRLLFALMVAAYHLVALPGVASMAPYEPGFARLAEIGVQGFFVISGYLVFASLERSQSVADYAEKRVRRLYPAYAAVVIFCSVAALVFVPEARADLAAVGRYLGWNLAFLNFMEPELPGLFAQNRFTEVNGALWTLKIEVMFYLVLPLIAWALHVARNMRWVLLAGIYVLAETWRLGLPVWAPALSPGAAGDGLWVELSRQLPGQMAFFVTGMALYMLRDHVSWRSLLPVLGVVLLAVSVVFPAAQPLRPLALGVTTIWIASGVPHMFNAARFGDFSYGVYITHFPMIQVMVAMGLFATAPLAAGFGAVGATLLGAVFLWWAVERPFLRRDSAYRDPGMSRGARMTEASSVQL